MYRIDSCPCCQSSDLRLYPAVVAPFLAWYAFRTPPFRCSLMECRNCSLRFFDSRLTPEEVERLYTGYRGEEYFRSRHRCEFWYTRKFNTGVGHDGTAIALEKAGCRSLPQEARRSRNDRGGMDYGGDEGQFIPDAVGKEKYVFELSDAAPVKGVTKIGSEAELRARRFDLVMICHVLEHCSDPARRLRSSRNWAAASPRSATSSCRTNATTFVSPAGESCLSGTSPGCCGVRRA